MTIRKAIITAAGFGTRFLPITKSIQKEMLPILNRPTIDYLVDDCVKAGISEIIIVIKKSDNNLVKHYFTEFQSLRDYLVKMCKLEENSRYLKKYDQIKFTFINQSPTDMYGTAVPVALSKKYLQKEDAFVVLMGDDFLFNKDGKSETAEMIKYFKKNQPAAGLATCITKPDNELCKYGVAQTGTENNIHYLKNLIEKPQPGKAPSNLVNISKYIFTRDIFEIIENQKPNLSNGELYITDSISSLAQANNVLIYEPHGEYLDSGTVSSWLKANLTVVATDPELKTDIKKFLEETRLFG